MWRRTSRRAVVITPARDVVELSGLGALVWDLLDEERAVTDVAAELAAVFEVDPGEALATVGEIVQAAVEAGALRPR